MAARNRRLRLATRGSPLALVQARSVARRLGNLDPACDCDLVVVETRADKRTDLPIAAFAGQGAFAAEVELALIDGRADVAVHSAKDLPASPSLPGLVLAAVPERADARDALVGAALDDLRPGALVATGAVRRRAQLAWLRPDLGFVELRGNIATRLSRRPPGGAVVVAAAALARLGLSSQASEILDTSVLLPQVGQGAIALRCRQDDDEARVLLRSIDDPAAHLALRAERAFLAWLGGGCDAPVGAHALALGDGGLSLEVLAAARDGHGLARRRGEGEDPEELGSRLAAELVEHAGAELLLGRV